METELPGTLIGAGRNADVYDIGGGRVLRRYRDRQDAARDRTEAQVMAHAQSVTACRCPRSSRSPAPTS